MPQIHHLEYGSNATNHHMREEKASPSQPTLRDAHLVMLEKGEDGMVVAKCPEINVVTQGRTVDESEKNAVEAVGLMREEIGNDNEFSISARRML